MSEKGVHARAGADVEHLLAGFGVAHCEGISLARKTLHRPIQLLPGEARKPQDPDMLSRCSARRAQRKETS